MTADTWSLLAAAAVCAVFACCVWLADRADRPAPAAGTAPPAPPAPAPRHERRAPDLAALTRGPHGTGWLEPVPDDDPADVTGVQPVATSYLGMPTQDYLDQLYARYEEAQREYATGPDPDRPETWAFGTPEDRQPDYASDTEAGK